MWQSLPVELVQRVLHELVSIHLWDIDSDPFYPWETLRQLNHQQRRRIDALYRQLLLPISNLTLWTEFCPTSKHSPDDLDSGTGLLYRFWVWDEDKGYNSTNDTITLSLAGTETMLSVDDDEGFDTSKGWTKYVNSFPPGGLYVNPQPDYGFTLKLSSPPRPGYSPDFHLSLQGEIPASHVPDVQDDSDDDSIKLSSSQLIGALIRAWKKRIIEYERQGIWKTQWYIPLERLDDLPEV